MSQTRVLVLLAGAALSIGAPALAQNANLDKDRAYAAELVNDAGSRASLLQGDGGGAGRDAKGFYITDGTGNNTLYLGGAAQFRYQHNFREDDQAGPDSDFTHGFSHRNVRLWWFGNVWSKDLSYKIQANLPATRQELNPANNWANNLEAGNNNVGLEDVWANYAWDNGVSVKWGQFKLPIFREESIASEHLLGLDRSNNNDAFSQGYSQGVQLSYVSDSFRMSAAFSDGAGYAAAANQYFTYDVDGDGTIDDGADPNILDGTEEFVDRQRGFIGTANTTFDQNSEADFAITLRGDVKFAGNDWSRFDDFTSFKNQDFAGYVGAAFHYQDGGATGDVTSGAEVWHLTLDTQMEGAGWNVFAAIMASNMEYTVADVDNDPTVDLNGDLDNLDSTSYDFTNYGVVVQGGLFVSDQAELFARWDAIFWDDSYIEDAYVDGVAAGTNFVRGYEEFDNNHFLTLGANYYISPESHAVKFTTQLTWALNPTDTAVYGVDDPDGNPATNDGTVGSNNESPFENNSILGQAEGGEISLGFQMQVMF